MSEGVEDDRDLEIESDDEPSGNSGRQYLDKRAHHNALERKRRDHIKESFSGLRDAIPIMQGDKSSRAQILKKASEYISCLSKKASTNDRQLDDLRRQNAHLHAQIRVLERAKKSGTFNSAEEVLEENGLNYDFATETIDVPDADADEDVDADAGDGAERTKQTKTIITSPQSRQQVQVVQVPSVRTIQPGQSVLIPPSANGEPVFKKMKH